MNTIASDGRTFNIPMPTAAKPTKKPPAITPARIFDDMRPSSALLPLPGHAGLGASVHQMLGDQHALHFACALANLMRIHITIVTRNRVLIHEAIASMNLHRLSGGALGGLRGEELCHRR